MKSCFKCGEEKELTSFYKHPMMSDGRLNKCKECAKKDTAENLARKMKDPVFVLKEAARHRAKSERYRMDGVKFNNKNDYERTKRFRAKNPLKFKAHSLVNDAIKIGFLKKEPCVKCGELKVQAHHEDYTKPLDVVWLCVKHHAERHVEINDAKRIAKAMQLA